MTGSRLSVRAAGAAVAIVTTLGVSACSSGGHPAAVRATAAPRQSAEVPVSLALAPARGATGQPVTTEIGTTVTGGQVTSVVLINRSGQPVAGTMRADRSSWVPDGPLEYSAPYTATVTAVSANGKARTESTTFTTMADPGSNRIGTGMYLTTGETYGVGLPLAIEFDEDIPEAERANVQRRLFVSSSPPQVGAWHWYGGRQVIYRPRTYWQPGTRVALRAALGGLPVGRRFVDADRNATMSIGNQLEMIVENSTKHMTVFRDGVLVRSIPVSLGKASTPSSSGRMVVMSRAYETVFDTTREGPGGYRVNVNYAERLTWGGEFIHAAPWSVGDQGFRNVSHGCINMSTEDAAWVYGNSHVGDPVTVTGTGTKLTPGNGWTAWDMSWPDYLAGSALPVADQPAAAPQAARPGF